MNLYKIFCQIFSENLNNSVKIKKFLENFALTVDAKEVLLFNKKTSLFISSYTSKENKEQNKIEKICFSLKKMANKLIYSDNKFNEMMIQNKMGVIYITEFNKFCYIVIILENNKKLELAKLNIEIGRKIFEEDINMDIN